MARNADSTRPARLGTVATADQDVSGTAHLDRAADIPFAAHAHRVGAI